MLSLGPCSKANSGALLGILSKGNQESGFIESIKPLIQLMFSDLPTDSMNVTCDRRIVQELCKGRIEQEHLFL